MRRNGNLRTQNTYRIEERDGKKIRTESAEEKEREEQGYLQFHSK